MDNRGDSQKTLHGLSQSLGVVLARSVATVHRQLQNFGVWRRLLCLLSKKQDGRSVEIKNTGVRWFRDSQI